MAYLEKKRDTKALDSQKNDLVALDNLRKKHDESFKIKDFITKSTGSDKEVLKFLIGLNKGPSLNVKVKTLILLDGTGSMSNLIKKCKESIETMYERAREILTDPQYGLDES